MKLLFDQNISHRVVKFIPQDFYHASSVKSEGLINASDLEIWRFAQLNNYMIVTQDSDFNDLNLLYGFPPKIIWLRTGNLGTNILAGLLIDYYSEIKSFANNKNYGCFEIYHVKTQH